MVVRGLVLLCPSRPLDTAVVSRSDGGGEGRVLRGLVLLCPLSSLWILLHSLGLTVEGRVGSYGVWYCCAPSLPLDTAVFGVWSCCAPPDLWILRYSLVLTVEGRGGSHGVWYCCAPFLPLDTAAFFRFDS